MKTLGIITEYNPFHQGHAYMLERAKRKADADRVVVIMSGSFVQRGEPAIFDKWTRTAAALKNGADLVLELPVLFAAANAEAFARGAVRLLTESGIVDTLAFGSESGNLQELQEAAKILANETEEFQRLLKELLGEGLSYPAARAKVLETLSQINSDILSKPNDILGLEYLKALDYYSSPILPLTIRRKGDYNSLSLSNGYASASAVRKALTEENSTEAMLHLPENTHDLYNKALSIGTAPVFWDALMPALHYKLRTTSIEELKEMCGKLAERGPKHIVVTGIHFNQTQIANFIYNKGEDFQIVMVDRIGGDRSGTGDVIAAIIAGMYLNGHSLYESVKKAADYVSKCIRYCEENEVPSYWGLCFEMFMKDLTEEA